MDDAEKETIVAEIKRIIGDPRLIHFTVGNELVTCLDDYVHFMKRDGRLVCIDILTQEESDIIVGHTFAEVFGAVDDGASRDSPEHI